MNVLHQMIQDEILDQQAAKLNLTASDEDVNAKLTEIKAPTRTSSSTLCSSSATFRWTTSSATFGAG